MKLASLKSTSSRDGQLCSQSVINYCNYCPQIAPNLQYALDHWHEVEVKLQELYQRLNEGQLENTFDFNPQECTSPCLVLTNGQMAALMLIMSNWFAKLGVQNFQLIFGLIRLCTKEVQIPS